MSIVLVGRALATPRLSAQEKLLLVTLADAANEDGECWPGRVRIAERCCCSARHVGRLVERLVERGLVAVTDRGPKTNTYVVFPEASEDICDVDDPDVVRTSATPCEDILHVRGSAIPGTVSEPSVSTTYRSDVRPDVEQVVEAFALHVADQRGRPVAAGAAWRTDVRLLLDLDRVSLEDALRIVAWLRGPGGARFWASVVLSPAKLRKHFPALRSEAARSNGSAVPDRVGAAHRLADELRASGQ